MEDEGAVAEEGGISGERGCEGVDIGGGERVGGDLAVFAGKVAYLAGLWESAFAAGRLTADKGVEMSAGVGAVSITCDGGFVDVVHWVGQ